MGQKDKAGKRYYLHPKRLASQCQDDDQKIVAYLHDTVEDNPRMFSIEKARRLFGDEVADALNALTHREGESYPAYLARVKRNPLALHVKLLDLRDNMDLSRISNPTEKDINRVKNKYQPALEYLSKT